MFQRALFFFLLSRVLSSFRPRLQSHKERNKTKTARVFPFRHEGLQFDAQIRRAQASLCLWFTWRGAILRTNHFLFADVSQYFLKFDQFSAFLSEFFYNVFIFLNVADGETVASSGCNRPVSGSSASDWWVNCFKIHFSFVPVKAARFLKEAMSHGALAHKVSWFLYKRLF